VQLISESLGAVNIVELPPLSLLSLSNYQLPPQTLLPLLRYFVIHIYSLHAPSLPRSTFTYFTSLVTLQRTRFVCRNSEEQFLMPSRDTRSAAGSAVDSAAEPAASLSPASIPPPTLSGEAPTSQKRKASQLSTSSQMPLNPLMPPPPPPRRSRRVTKEDPEPGSLPSPPPRRRQAKQPKAMATSG